ncbi:ComF family protein, partial [Streptomyces mexicanus]|uniref:ComF family protein n=1 Tax=Streptomyces mexicanus TaxID=178566 RepID=UPI003CD086AE
SAVAGSGAARGQAPVLLVPVPSARAAVRARGHDPARRIALAAAGELRRSGIAARVLAVLRQRRAVSDQARLDSRQRLDNLAGALGTVPGGARLLLAGPVVLVDDLMTTGASLREAARAVKSAVYAARVREEMGEHRAGGPRKEGNPVYRAAEFVGADDAGDVICAAVVAASPDSFVDKQELTENARRCR